MATLFLTDPFIRSLRPLSDKEAEYRDRNVRGLTLRLSPAGKKTWTVQFRVNGRTRRMTLGHYDVFTLADARRRAREALYEVAVGKDPAAAKQDALHAETFADLEPYCHRVASSVGLMCAEIFGYRERAVLDYARDLGVALQLTNILRDVAVDYRVGRFYLPAADLAKFGVTEHDIRQEVERAGNGVRSEKVRAVLAHHASRAREYFDRAVRALPREDASRFVAAEIMRAIYWELLCRIEAAHWDVFTALIRIPRPAQARLAIKTWWSLRR